MHRHNTHAIGLATRRRFLKTAATTAGSFCAASVVPETVFGVHAPSNPTREENARQHIDADHVRNFIDSVKSRRDPIEPVEVGHSTASLCLLGNIAQLLKRKFTWDPATERSPDDEVNQMLSRPMQAPWKLPS